MKFYKRLKKIRNRLEGDQQKSILKPKKDSEGLTLADMALAILVTSVLVITMLNTIMAAKGLQVEANRLSVALVLAQSKMASYLSNPTLTSTSEKKELGSDYGIFSNYHYEIEVKEEQIDMMKVQETGKLSSVKQDDLLPAGPQNSTGKESAGSSTASATGGLIDIIRIILKVTYPRGGGKRGIYRVETIRSSPKKS